ncbi:cell division ATP-binding protein FtsE [Patescibacteria group bacterium]
MIKVEDVSKDYAKKKVVALSDVTFDVEEGEFVTIVGQSGAGKSTLVRLLIAEERPDKGRIIVNNWDVGLIKPRHIPIFRRQIGVVFQDFKLLEKKTTSENVAFAMEVCGRSRREIKEQVPKILDIVNLTKQAEQFPHQLSGGEKQRVAIARALIHKPKLLVADEPTGNLDSLNAWEIVQLLLKINELGTTVLMVSHNREIVNAVKRRVVTLDEGELVRNQNMGKYIL